MIENNMLDRRFAVAPLMDWTDQHCRSSHRLMRCRSLHAEMVASAALVEFNRSDFCKGTRSCSIIWFRDQV
jgi:tRNA-dihydrouridine synthase